MRHLADWLLIVELAALVGGYWWFVNKLAVFISTRRVPKVRSRHPLHSEAAIRRTLAREFRRMERVR